MTSPVIDSMSDTAAQPELLSVRETVLWRHSVPAAESLARLVAMAGMIAPLVGENDAEQHEVILTADSAGLRMMTEGDKSGSTTLDGSPRPFRLMADVPGTSEATDPSVTQWAVRARIEDILRSLRTRQEQAERQGVISGPVTLELLADEQGRPRQLRVIPAGSVPRMIELTARLDPTSVPARGTAKAVTRSVGRIQGDTWLTLGQMASEGSGVLIEPGYGELPPHVAAVGARGSVVMGIEAEQLDLESSMDGNRPDAMIVSPRMAHILGLLQDGVVEVARQGARAQLQEITSKAQAAAVTALLDIDGDTPGALYAAAMVSLGEIGAQRLLSTVDEKSSVVDQAVAFANTVITDEPTTATRLTADSLRQGFAQMPGTVAPSVLSVLREAIPAGDDQGVRLALATGYLSAGGNTPVLVDRIATVLGEQEVFATVTQMRGGIAPSDATPMERPESAKAMIRVAQKRHEALLDALLRRVDDQPEALEGMWNRIEAWQEEFGGITSDWRKDFQSRRTKRGAGARPTATWWRPSDGLRQQMMEAAARETLGRVGVDAEGRVSANWSDARLGSFVISDVAIQPDPKQFPLSEASRADALRKQVTAPTGFVVDVHADDLRRIGLRVSGMIRPDRPRQAGPDGRITGPVVIGRWSADSNATVQQVTSALDPKDRQTITSETAWMDGKEIGLPRSPDQFPIAKANDVGTFRLFAVDPWGERQVLHLPMRALRHAPDTPSLAFAVEAADFERFCSTVASSERTLTLSVAGGVIELRDTAQRTVASLTSIGQDRMPESVLHIAQRAGVALKTPESPLRDAVTASRSLKVPRAAGIALRETKSDGVVRVAAPVLDAENNASEQAGAGRAAAGLEAVSSVAPKVGTIGTEATKGASTGAPAENTQSAGQPTGTTSPWITATMSGAEELRGRDAAIRESGRKAKELRLVLSKWPILSDKEVFALRTTGGWGKVFATITADDSVRRHLYRTRWYASLRELQNLLRDIGQGGDFNIDGTTLDLFSDAGGALKGHEATVNATIEQQALIAFTRVSKVREKLKRLAEDLELSLGIQKPVVRSGVSKIVKDGDWSIPSLLEDENADTASVATTDAGVNVPTDEAATGVDGVIRHAQPTVARAPRIASRGL